MVYTKYIRTILYMQYTNTICFIGFAITTTDLDITVGLITVGFVRTGSDVPSLPVMSLKIKNDWG